MNCQRIIIILKKILLGWGRYSNINRNWNTETLFGKWSLLFNDVDINPVYRTRKSEIVCIHDG